MHLFATVGAQMPFDRLIGALDRWAGEHPEHPIFAQIGRSTLHPENLRWERFIAPEVFTRAFDEADAIIGHAGTGTLFAAMERAKPILILPRRAALRETRNDHQVATARRFESFAGVAVAWGEEDLPRELDALSTLPGSRLLPPQASGPLIETLARFFDEC